MTLHEVQVVEIIELGLDLSGRREKKIFKPRIELGTFRVLGGRDNQLHHLNIGMNAPYRDYLESE